MSGEEEHRSLGYRDFKHLEQHKKSIVVEAGSSSSEVFNSINSVEQEKSVGWVTKTEERVHNLLDQLLSHNGEDLDGVRVVTNSQEHLRIKPDRPQNLSLPDMQSVHRNKMNVSGGNLPKRHSIISDVLNALKSAQSVLPITPSPSRKVASPISSESLLAIQSSINRHFSLFSRASKDLCSAQDIPTRTYSLTRQNERKPNNVEPCNLDGKFEDADLDLSCFVDDSVPLPAQSNAKIEDPDIPATSLEQPVDNDIILGTEHHAEIPEDGSQRATKKISKARARSLQHKCKTSLQPDMHKNNRTLRRHSLAVAGTSWENGVRRTTRIRTKPLEYWRGERLLLGRVEKNLVTVIGMKYTSSKDGQPDFKVKSYVSDKYKDLVEKAASH